MPPIEGQLKLTEPRGGRDGAHGQRHRENRELDRDDAECAVHEN
jgi:hypothetical protein